MQQLSQLRQPYALQGRQRLYELLCCEPCWQCPVCHEPRLEQVRLHWALHLLRFVEFAAMIGSSLPQCMSEAHRTNMIMRHINIYGMCAGLTIICKMSVMKPASQAIQLSNN